METRETDSLSMSETGAFLASRPVEMEKRETNSLIVTDSLVMSETATLLATLAELQQPPPPPLIGDVSPPRCPRFSGLQDELQRALREELPAALERELPRALESKQAHWWSTFPSVEASTKVRAPADDAIDEDEGEETEGEEDAATRVATMQPLANATLNGEKSLRVSLHSTLHDEMKPMSNNKFFAKKYFQEFQESDTRLARRQSLTLPGAVGVQTPPPKKTAFCESSMPIKSMTRMPSITSLGDEGDSSRNSCALGPPIAKRSVAPEDLRRCQLTQTQKGHSERTDTMDRSTLGVHRAGLLQLRALEATESYYFVAITTTLICLNAFIMGWQTEHMAQTKDTEAPLSFKIVEFLFCIAFTLELAIRMVAFNKRFFIHDWHWNIFDSVLVVTQIIEVAIEFSASDNNGSTNVSFLRILRILRLVRVMRLVRIVRYISELRCIISSVFNSLKSLFFTVILIAFLIYVLGVALTQLVTEHAQNSDDAEAKAQLNEFFGSVPWSCLVLFQTMTNGIDWGDVASPLTKHISPVMAPMLCMYVSFAQFAMLNVITGVFVESALASDAEEKDATMVGRLMDFLIGSEDPRFISWDEFQQRLDDPTIQLYFQSVDLDPAEAKSLFVLLDVNQTGTIEAEEFIMGCLRLRGSAKAIDLATMMYENRRWFRRFEMLMLDQQKRAAQAAKATKIRRRRQISPSPPPSPQCAIKPDPMKAAASIDVPLPGSSESSAT